MKKHIQVLVIVSCLPSAAWAGLEFSPTPAPASNYHQSIKAAAAKSYPQTHWQKALYFKQSGNVNQALIEFLKATQENPKMVAAYYEQALIFHQRGYLKLAKSALEQSLSIQPSYQQARLLLATIQLEDGKLDLAIQELGQSLKMSMPNNPAPTQAAAVAKPKVTVEPAPAKTPPTFIITPEPDPPSVASEPIPDSLKGIPGIDPGATDSPTPIASPNIPSPKVVSTPIESPPPQTIAGVYTTDIKHKHGWFKHHQKKSSLTMPKGNKSNKDEHPVKGPKNHKITKSAAIANSLKAETKTHTPNQSKLKLSSGWSFFGLFKKHADQVALLPVNSAISTTPKAIVNTAPATIASANGNPVPAYIMNAINSVVKTPTPLTVTTSASLPAIPPSPVDRPAPTLITPHLKALTETRVVTHSKPAPPVHTNYISKVPSANLPTIVEDSWTIRMKFLLEQGTATLKTGEAFMYTEESGEGILFLPNGQVVRRQIAPPQDPQEIARMRRPDTVLPEGVAYNLSLLGRVLPKADPAPTQSDGPRFSLDQLMSQRDSSPWSWVKNKFKLP